MQDSIRKLYRRNLVHSIFYANFDIDFHVILTDLLFLRYPFLRRSVRKQLNLVMFREYMERKEREHRQNHDKYEQNMKKI